MEGLSLQRLQLAKCSSSKIVIIMLRLTILDEVLQIVVATTTRSKIHLSVSKVKEQTKNYKIIPKLV